MNYLHPELIDNLASEYVTGTLRGSARRRFERLMAEHYWVRAAVWQWESQLLPLTAAIQSVQPAPQVWQQIKAQIGARHPVKPKRSSFLWPVWGAITSLLAIGLAVLLAIQPTSDGVDVVAVFDDSSSVPLWAISADLDSGRITARALNATAAEVDQVFELWMLPADGDAPRSLGVLPVSGGQSQSRIPAGLAALLKANAGLAISIEPVGGSPTGVPTGPVIHQAQWVPATL